MDDDFFDDDDGTLANLAEDELQALENNAVFQYTQLQHHQQAVGPARSSHLNTWSNTPPRTTTAAQTNAQTRFHSDNYNSRQNVSTYGVGTLAIVPTAGIDQNQNLRSPIPERFDETVEVWNADGPPTTSAAYPGQRHQQSYPSHYGGGIGGGETTYRQQHGHDTRVSEALHQPHQGGYYQQQQHQEATNLYQGQLGNQHDEQYFDQGDVVVDDNTEVDRHHNKGNQWVDYKQQEGSAQAQEFQRMVSKLEEERNRLHQELRVAQDTVLIKTGEVSIVRKNIEKAQMEHERLVQSLQNLQMEEREKHRREVEALKAEAERVQTRNKFLSNDYQELLRNNRTLEKNRLATQSHEDLGASMERVRMTSASPVTTPRKKKFQQYRDGFDDDEIMISPSKAQTRARGTTPSRKRKRSDNNSPITLPLSQPRSPGISIAEKHLQLVDEFISDRLGQNDSRFDFLKGIITHRPTSDGPRTLELLTKLALPSSPDTSLSSVFLDKIDLLRSSPAQSSFCSGVCKALLAIWSEFLNQKFWPAFTLVLDLLHLGIMWDLVGTCAEILDEAVDLIQRTVDLNAIPRLRRDTAKLNSDIDVGRCLDLLECISLGVLSDEVYAKRFWKLIRFDFALMLLNPNQPIDHIQQMLSTLSSSVFTTSIGPLVSNEIQRRQNEVHLLDAATRLLIDAPTTTDGDVPKGPRIVELRKEVLQFLGCVVGTENGVKLVASHPTALTRLIRRVAEELEEVYDFKYGVKKRIEFINASIRILHGLITNPTLPTPIKFTGPSQHKYLVAMTRLAFSEAILQEEGIEEEVIEYAQEMLESGLTPQDAEALQGLFPRVSAG